MDEAHQKWYTEAMNITPANSGDSRDSVRPVSATRRTNNNKAPHQEDPDTSKKQGSDSAYSLPSFEDVVRGTVYRNQVPPEVDIGDVIDGLRKLLRLNMEEEQRDIAQTTLDDLLEQQAATRPGSESRLED